MNVDSRMATSNGARRLRPLLVLLAAAGTTLLLACGPTGCGKTTTL